MSTLLKSISKAAFIAVLILFSNLLILQSINSYAQAISIEPYEIDRKNPQERGWFIYKVKPGTTIEGNLVLRNDHPTNTSIELSANDGVSTPDGNFALASNSDESKLIGSWVQLDSKVYDVDGQTNVKVPFKIKVPENAAPGEYAGGLSVVQVQEGDQTGGGPVSSKIRVGARIYLTVEGDITQDVSASNLTIVNSKTPNIADELNTRGWINKDNMALRVELKQNGNIYSKFKGDITFKLPDGKEVKRVFTKDIIRNSPTNEYYLETTIPYMVGKTQVTMKYEVAPSINNKDGLNSKNDAGELTYEMNLTQDDVDQLTELRAGLDAGDVKEFGKKNTSVAAPKADFNIAGPTEEAKKDEDKDEDNNTVAFAVGGTITGLAVAGLIAFVVIKKKKSNPEVKSEMAVEAKKESKKDTKKTSSKK